MRDLTMSGIGELAAPDTQTAATFAMTEEAFRAFYDQTARGVWAYLARLTGDRQLADDLLQDAYYRFLRADREYADDTHRRNALYRIATNLARDAHRRARHRPDQAPMGDDVPGPEGVAVGDVAQAVQVKTDLSQAMARLSRRERELLWLAYAQGFSHQEIADGLGLKRGSIKQLLSRARQRLSLLLRGGTR